MCCELWLKTEYQYWFVNGRKSQTRIPQRRQKKISILGDVCGDYDYNYQYDVKHTGPLQQ